MLLHTKTVIKLYVWIDIECLPYLSDVRRFEIRKSHKYTVLWWASYLRVRQCLYCNYSEWQLHKNTLIFCTMESLMSPKFKSKVEQFYYDHLTEPQEETEESLKILTARKGAYSGDGRKSYFSFDSADIKSFNAERRNFMFYSRKLTTRFFLISSIAGLLLLISRPPSPVWTQC